MTSSLRTGLGFDAHRFSATGRVVLAGIVVSEERGVAATSDGDVVAHAVADALLGAVTLGDIGELFPSGDARWVDADSMELLAAVVARLAEAGHRPSSVDVTVVAEKVRVAPHRSGMRDRLGGVLGIEPDRVSVKATTTDGMGSIGRDEGLACLAVAVVEPV